MNTCLAVPRKEPVLLACLVVLLGLGTGKAFADDDHDRLRREQRKNQQGQQNQGQQQPQGQHQQQPQRQQERPQQGQPQQHQPPPQHQQPPYQPPQQNQPQPRQEPRWGGPHPSDRHDEHEHQGMPARPEPAPMQHGRAAPEMQHPGRPMQPPPPPRFEHERPMPAQPAHMEHGRPMSAPPPHFERSHPMAPMHMGRPLAPAQPIYVDMAPPRARYEVRPQRPSPMHIWIGGYWGWENDTQVWIGGEWAEPPQPGYAWEAPRWKRHGHRWSYSPGYWRHHGGPVYAPPMVSDPAYGGGVTISGRVMSMQGTPVPGIVVTLAGTQEGRIVTDGGGYYSFSGLPQGSYAVRPTGGGCAFAPDVANLNNLYGSVTQDIIVSGCGGW